MVLEGYVTLEELAQRLGLKSAGALRTQIARGVLTATRAGHNWWVTEEEAKRYENENRRRGRPPKKQPGGTDG